MSSNNGQPLTHQYIAKSPSQQLEFLKKYPNFDGNGVVIAIIDSCIDISLPGLQKTSKGLPKIIDCFDFTGNGNVDTTNIKNAENGNLKGLSGRFLEIPSHWKNPDGKYHLGIKSIYELCDCEALKNIIKLRKQNLSKQTNILKASNKTDKFMLQYLDAVETDLRSNSVVADCIVWFDGNQWQACIDTSFCGKLEGAKVMSNFRECHEFGEIFGIIPYCFTIHSHGNMLEIYVPFSDHGTIIANVASAFFDSDENDKNGLSPGAQIVSMAVVDPRNEECPSENAVVKAFQKCLKLGVDVISFSLGEIPHATFPLIKEMQEKFGTVIVKAAGNDGPIHSSLYDTDLFLQNSVFQVGSCITSDMKERLYNNVDDECHSIMISSFSSRGPLSNDSRGIHFIAPGHGYAERPRYFAENHRIFEATSHSAPNAAGGIACIISGLKSMAIPICIFKLKLALANTALLPEGEENKLASDKGIIQIHDAFEYYRTNLQTFPKDIKNIFTSVLKPKTIFSWNNSIDIYDNGVTLKILNENVTSYKFTVKIYAEFSEFPTPKIQWILKSQTFSSTPIFLSHFQISNENGTFELEINAKHLPSNTISFAEIAGTDSSNPIWGPLFRFPITVISPKFITEFSKINEIFILNSKNIQRYFLKFHSNISKFYIKITNLDEKKFTLKTQHSALNEKCYDKNALEFEFVSKNQYQKIEFDIDDSYEIYEICMYRKLYSAETLNLKFELFPQKLTQFSIFNVDHLPEMKPTSRIDTSNDYEICLSPQKVKLQDDFIATYVFEVESETYCNFDAIYSDIFGFQPYKPLRIQVFTLSKKFVVAFIDQSPINVKLKKGIYKIKGIFKLDKTIFFQKVFSMFVPYPKILLTINSKNAIKPFPSMAFEIFRSLKTLCQFFLPYTTQIAKYLYFATPKNASKFQRIIHKFYLAKDSQNLTKTVNSFMKAMDGNFFLKIYFLICGDGNEYEKELIKSRNDMILEAQFLKADLILNQCLSNLNGIPAILKSDLGFDLISETLNSESRNSTYANLLKTAFDFSHFVSPNHTSLASTASQKQITKKSLKQICCLVLKYAEESDFRRDLIIAKNALIFGEIGTALFHFNKISQEHSTIPRFQIFDRAIIELLKHLQWIDLAEVHENALLDKHRNYYLLF